MPPELASRSTQGCWTCRLRKKKCDENHPACFRCTSLGITCDGYGPRPFWMDRGELQRQQALYKKQIIAQIKSAGKLPSAVASSCGVELELGNNPAAGSSSAFAVRPAQQQQQQQQRQQQQQALMLPGLQLRDADDDSIISGEPLWGDGPGFSAGFFYDQIFRMNMHDSSPDRSKAPSTSASSPGDGTHALNSINSSTTNSHMDPDMDTMDTSCDQLLSESSTSEGCRYSSRASCGPPSVQAASSPWSTSLPPPPPQQNGLSNPILRGDVEDILFMYYFDQVFYIYCPFYFPSTRHGRAWLFSILKRVRSAYHAALALSERHHSDPSLPVPAPSSRLRRGHYDMALQELQTSLTRSSAWSGNLGLPHNVEVLTTILHLLFYESSVGGKGSWQIHLGGANTLLPALVGVQLGAIKARKESTGGRNAKMPRPDTSISFLLGFFTYMDIMACASTRSGQFLTLDHKLLLETGEIDLADLTGCSNWAMILISEIASLDKWKREEEEAHRLSLIEFTKRGCHIDERLRSGLAGLASGSPGRFPPNDHLRPESIKNEITRIFALSAITYLHVVISGAFPEIPEIKKNVSKVMDALRNLPDPGLLRHVVWPYCIAGCLARSDQQQMFRELVFSAQVQHGACLEALGIMEECWRTRRTATSSCDWASIMKKRGQFTLLA